jgi:hypothetical protein
MDIIAAKNLIYWIKTREAVRVLKEAGYAKPWTEDKVFQETYFCNVRREDDKTTRFIRQFYSNKVYDPMFEYNIILSRFVNNPSTLAYVGYIERHDPAYLERILDAPQKKGAPVWGNAYIVSTCGKRTAKGKYLAETVLGGLVEGVEGPIRLRVLCRHTPTLSTISTGLQSYEGIGSFMAGQIVADLKNTPGHQTVKCEDWETFVTPGPGSVRGCSWFASGVPDVYGIRDFYKIFGQVREYVDEHWEEETMGPPICNQDLQNCLCEFDKYMRVSTGFGRSKRRYNGSHD